MTQVGSAARLKASNIWCCPPFERDPPNVHLTVMTPFIAAVQGERILNSWLDSGQVVITKLCLVVAVPAGVVMVISPVVAPAGTCVTTVVAVSEMIGAGVPLNATL